MNTTQVLTIFTQSSLGFLTPKEANNLLLTSKEIKSVVSKQMMNLKNLSQIDKTTCAEVREFKKLLGQSNFKKAPGLLRRNQGRQEDVQRKALETLQLNTPSLEKLNESIENHFEESKVALQKLKTSTAARPTKKGDIQKLENRLNIQIQTHQENRNVMALIRRQLAGMR